MRLSAPVKAGIQELKYIHMSEKHLPRKLALFGVALDPTDDELKLEFKAIQARNLAAGRIRFKNPYEALTGVLQDLTARGLCEASGEVEIPSWLTPTPNPSDLPLLTAENNLRFIDEGGCDEVAESVRAFLEAGSVNGIPAMIAVDHSTTGGALRALAKEHGPSDVAVLVVDSHFDGLQLAERMELFRYGNETGFDDPQEVSVQESYNCATWLKHMVDEKVVLPDRLILFGVSDYPAEAMRQNPRLSRYVGAYRTFEEAGVTFVTREEIRQKGVSGALEPLLNGMAADRLYVSLDADIGSLDAVHAARFMNVVGLSSEELFEIARVLEETLREKELIGLDVCGIETFLLGREFPNGTTDRTLERLSDFVRILLGREAMYSRSGNGRGRPDNTVGGGPTTRFEAVSSIT
jgi:arginase family enzyme